MKHIHQRWIAAAMSLVLAASCTAPASAAAPGVPVGDGRTPTYDEAYYATLDYYGNLTEGSVVKSYVLNGATAITDYGEYESVSNLTNGVVPTQSAKRVAFDFTGEDAAPTHFYFQGKTAQPYNDLPWKLSVSYTLNGVPTKAEDLAGKTGVVEINVDAIPNKNVSDYARHNYTLEAMALFNQDDILSLEAPGAQVQLLGNLRAVLFVAFPGEEGHYTIRVGADKFEFGGMTFLMVPATLSQLDQISKLAQRKEDLESNYEKLSGSLDALLDSLDAVSGSLYSSANGLDALNAARGTVSAGKGDVYATADQALGDLDAMSAALEPFSEELGVAARTLGSTNVLLGEMADTTVSLREDIDTIDKSLQNAQGDKEELLKAIADMERLQSKLQYTATGLSNTQIAQLPMISGGAAFGVPDGVDLSSLVTPTQQNDLTAAQKLYGIGAAGDQNQFLTAALSANGAMTAEQASQAAAIYSAIASGTATAQDIATKNCVEAAMQKGMTQEQAIQYITMDPTGQATLQGATAQIQGVYDQVSAPCGSLSAAYTAADNNDFSQFVYNLSLAQGKSTEEAKDAAEKAQLATAAGTINNQINSEISTMVNQANASLAGTISDVNYTIGITNNTISSINALMKPTADLLATLSVVCGDVTAIKPAIENADTLVELAQQDNEKLKSTLDSVEKLQKLLDSYQPELDRTIAEAQTVSRELTVATTDTSAFLRSAESLLQSAGTQLDDATRESLSSLAAALRGTAAALRKGNGVRSAKDTINDMVEDVWSDYTGDVSDLLEMDATAEAVSLTDPRNPAPASVQVLIRTQEIKAAEPEAQTVAAKTATNDEAESTFLGRVEAMFSNMWSAIVGLFRR